MSLSSILWILAGGSVTLLLAGLLLYWIDQEWRDLDRQARANPPVLARPVARANQSESTREQPPPDALP